MYLKSDVTKEEICSGVSCKLFSWCGRQAAVFCGRRSRPHRAEGGILSGAGGGAYRGRADGELQQRSGHPIPGQGGREGGLLRGDLQGRSDRGG